MEGSVRPIGAGRRRNAKGKMQNAEALSAVLHFAFCLLPFAFILP
jgi:hypothetical protein